MAALRLGRITKAAGVIVLALTMAAGWWMGRSSVDVPVAPVNAAVQEDAVAAFRTEREQLRAMQKAQLN